MDPIIKIENLSKQYRLGNVGTGTLSHDLNRWWANLRGKEDPFLKIGETNTQNAKGASDYVWALKDINLEVMPGEVLGIIGKNGAGKSTLLKLLSRVTAPTTGSIKARGRIASLLEVGTGFHPELTGRENIFLNGAILGMTKAEIRGKFDEIVDFAGVERYIDTPVKRYSSGMYVRLAFAVAAHLEPEILVVDEVLAVGDAEFQKKAIGKMQDVSRNDGRTVLFVSHNMAAIKTLCNKGMYLKNGTVLFEGTEKETITKYLSDSYSQIGISIENRTDRIGNGRIKVKKLVFKNKSNIPTFEIMAGDYLRIEFEIDKDPEIELNKMILACGFSDTYENVVVSWVSDEMKQNFDLINENKFSLEISKFNIRPNTYNFNYQISYLDTALESFCDVLLSAISINVLPSNFFYSGKNIRPGNSMLLDANFIF